MSKKALPPYRAQGRCPVCGYYVTFTREGTVDVHNRGLGFFKAALGDILEGMSSVDVKPKKRCRGTGVQVCQPIPLFTGSSTPVSDSEYGDPTPYGPCGHALRDDGTHLDSADGRDCFPDTSWS